MTHEIPNTIYARTRELVNLMQGEFLDEERQYALRIIKAGVLFYDPQIDNTPLLSIAAACGYTGMVRALVKAGADVNVSDENGNTPLHIAACGGKLNCLKALLNAGASPNPASKIGITPLMMAAQNTHSYCVDALIRLHVPVNATDCENRTALFHAATKADFSSIYLLMDAGASLWGGSEAHKDYPKTQAYLQQFVRDLHQRLYEGPPPETPEEVMRLVSVMPVENIHTIPEPQHQIPILFSTLPHSDALNALYKTCTGQERPPQAANLQQLRANARSSGVGL